MLRRTVLGRRTEEFCLDTFIVCFSAGNLFPHLELAATAAFFIGLVLCIDFSACAPHPRSHHAQGSYRGGVPIDFGRPG
jgi:hypothetical protein